MSTAPSAIDLDALVQRTATQRRGLIQELLVYLRQRQDATAALVQNRAREAELADTADRQRHATMVERLDRVEARIGRIYAQLDELRLATRPVLVPDEPHSPNGVAASSNGHVKLDEVPARPPGQQLLRVEGLAKQIGDADILDDINFSIYEGEILGLIGPNGAGKTTLMECLAGMRPRTGGVFYVGDDIPASWEPKELLFYLPNNVLPYGDLYTIEVLTSFGRLYEVDPPRWERIILRDLSLGPVLAKRVSALSKGNMQRLLIALALMSPQPLLALDEPFDGLDLHQTQAMMGILRGLREQSRTLLLCIHQLNDAERICDRLLLLSGGRLVGMGTLEELRAQTQLAEGSLEEIFLALT